MVSSVLSERSEREDVLFYSPYFLKKNIFILFVSPVYDEISVL